MHGINIGEDSLLAAASFLKDAVGDFEVWGGIPARILKKRLIDEPYL
jgi:acetyltransferase-like isoleucine patch superfamily enzyme